MEISKNSWHYKLFHFHHWRMVSPDERLFNRLKGTNVPDRVDFCTYFHQAIVRNFIYFIFLFLGLSILTLGIFNAVVLNFMSFVIALAFTVTVTVVVVGGSLAAVYAVLSVKNYLTKEENKPTNSLSEPNIFQVKYRSWKEKHCPIVEIKK